MQDFEVRRATLFASLDSAANEIGHKLKQTTATNIRAINHYDNHISERDHVNEHVIEEVHHRNNRLECIRGQGSIFLRPEAPINKCLKSRRLPDYQRNPHKWKKYSLADADDSDLANRVGALMFLQKMANHAKSIKNTKIEDNDEDHNEVRMANLNEKIEFNQRKTLNRDSMSVHDNTVDNVEQEPQNSSQIKDGKVVMPEYVIGKQLQNKTKKILKKTQNSKAIRAAGNLTLSHLQDDEENEEE